MPQYEDRPFTGDKSQDSQIWKIALGVALGIAIAGVLGFAVRMYFVNQAVKQFNESMLLINTQTQRSMQVYQERAAALQEAALESDNRQKAEKAAAQREAELSKRQLVDEVLRKEDAWSRFYRKPVQCDKAEGQAFMECANGYIRAKRQFEAQYAKGAL